MALISIAGIGKAKSKSTVANEENIKISKVIAQTIANNV